jgi:DNA processing protein
MMHSTCVPVEALLGGLNETERRYAPSCLFVAGRTELLLRRPRLSVVGTRAPSPAGVALATGIATSLAASRAVVVSGLAKGIDTAAHVATVRAGGDTIAVIGTALDRAYPAENRRLQDDLMKRHLVVSQFASGTSTTPRSFPMRNRTMALVSDATVIVEAAAKSGTESQGWEAIRLGRALFIHSSLPESGVDWACKMMIYGAQGFDTAQELLVLVEEFLPIVADARAYRELAAHAA